MAGRLWTPREDAILLDWRENKSRGWADIGIEIGRRAQSCACRYWNLRGSQKKCAIMSIVDIDQKKFAGELYAVLTERDERETARMLRDERAEQSGILTAIACGDPLPGYSALDKARAAT